MPEPVHQTRRESDSLGMIAVPIDAYFGAQTERARENFQVSGREIAQFPQLIAALAFVKKAAAVANRRLGNLTPGIADAICLACEEIIDGRLNDQFVVDVLQGGAGTSTNMNMNEVIANRALEHLDIPRGTYSIVHPIHHVNLSQSTNDVYPTGIRVGLLLAAPPLYAALEELAAAFDERAEAFEDVVKVGRTQLQDAVPMTLGQEFHAFAVTIREDVERLRDAAKLLHEVNLGGTAVGTGALTHSQYRTIAVQELIRLTELPLLPSADLVEACWDVGALVHYSGTLKRVAVKLSKIANDLRLLSSGPRGAIGEIVLPAVQAGSSMMPGKVNPVIPEMVNQVAFQVIGSDVTITLAAEAGQLQLNAMEPVIAFNLFHSTTLLKNAAEILARRCVGGIAANVEQCRRNLEAGTAMATALVPLLGYERVASLVKLAVSTGRPFRELVEQDTKLSREVLDHALDPDRMMGRSHQPEP